MAFTNIIKLIKVKLFEDPATLNNAHNTNMDLLTAFLDDMKTFVNGLQTQIDALSPTTSNVTLYNYLLDVDASDGVPYSDADGTSITRSGNTFVVVHITDLTNAVFQVVNSNGAVITQEMSTIEVNQGSPTNLTIELPTTFPNDLRLQIVNFTA